MVKNLKIICLNKNFSKILILFLGLIFAALLELIGLGSIPIFVMLITDINLLKSKIPNFLEIDYLFNLSTIDLVIYSATLLIVIFLIKNLYLSFIIFYQGIVFKTLRIELTSKLFSIYTNINYNFHLQNNPSILLRNVEGETSKAISVIQSIVSLIKEFLVLIVILFLILITDPLVSLSIFFFLGIFVGIFYLFSNSTILKNGKMIQFIRGEQVKHINQSFGAIKDVKVLNKESFLNKIFVKNLKIYESAFLVNYFLTSIPRLFLETIIIFAFVIIIVIFIFFDRNVSNIIPLLSLLAVSAVRLVPSFTTISTSLARIRNLSPSFNLIADEIVRLQNSKFTPKIYHSEKINFENEIKFEEIYFKYENTEKFALEKIDLNIKTGSKIGIIGSSGSGKSTFVDLFLGLQTPTKGKIKSDNKNIFLNTKKWHELISYVPQDIYLLDDTIKNNIAFGINDESFDYEKFKKAIKIAQLQEFLNNLKMGAETIVGNRGTRLSGGQKQRIGIARALYNDRKILIFDEATNSLDLENEKKIVENIFSLDKNKTLIIVTHRHETIKHCDEVLLFSDGKLIDKGKYNYLNQKYNLTLFIGKKNTI